MQELNRRIYCARSVTALCVAVLSFIPTGRVQAAVYDVTNASFSGAGSLSNAMAQAQSDSSAVINISTELGMITLTNTLPVIQNNLVINGNGNAISGAGSNRIFFVNAPGNTVQINGLTLSNGLAQGGSGGVGYGGGGGGAGLGGAIFLNAGNLTMSNIAFLNNSAQGGTGGLGFDDGFNATLGGGGGGGGLTFNGGGGAGVSIDNNTFEGPAGGGGALTSAGMTAIGSTGLGGTGGGVNGGIGGSAGLGTSAGNGGSPSLPDGGGGGGGLSDGPGNGGNGGSGSDFGGGGGAGSSENGNAGHSGNGGFGGGGGGSAFTRNGFPFDGGNGGFGGGGGGGGEGTTEGGTVNGPGGTNGFGGGGGASGASGNGGGGLGAGGAIFARAGSTLTIQDSTFNGDMATGGSAPAPATNGSAIGQALFLGANVNYSVSSGTIDLLETIGGGNDTNAEGGLTKSGAGTLALSAAASYVGETTVTAGTLVVSNNPLQSPMITINSGAVLACSYSSQVFQPGTTYAGAGTLRFDGPGNPVFGQGPINIDFSPGALIDIQSGTLTGSAAYNGLWTSNQASMNIAGGAVFDAVESGPSGTMQIDALTGQGTFQGGYVNNINGGLSTAIIGVAGGSGDFDGTLQDDPSARLGIVKTGSGTEIFSGTTKYSGDTIVEGGTQIVSNNTLQSGAITIYPNAVLEYAYSNRVLQPGTTYTGTGTLRFVGTGNPTFGSGPVSLAFSAGALIDIQSGTLTGSAAYNGLWTSNQASMNIASGAVFEAAEAGPSGTMQIDALTGGGIFQGGFSLNPNGGLSTVTIGVAGGTGIFSGTLQDDPSARLGIVKAGNGSEIFSGTNTYSGNTTVIGGTLVIDGTAGSGGVNVSVGTLAGTGTIFGAVDFSTSGTFAPGAPTGALIISNGLGLAGNTLITLNSGANSEVIGLTSVNYGGTLTVTNIGAPLSPGTSFTLFSAAKFSGSFSSIIGNAGTGRAFVFNRTNGVLSVVPALPTTPTNLTFNVNSKAMTLNWPSNYTGWILQSQTNPLTIGITTSNWVDISSSASTDAMSFVISPTNNVFFRLRLP